ncbi:YceD family protein [Ramlibacter tataouinensis]|uniref:YceD family protein n=1 Tax=Ramlibacter tataouinensis TaxID=94132 RepID=UPI0022F39417|nr:YceD family protein [Ramlibacter tataouinensis]WBY00871.1 YceD family protein [Ramlibacter tataouinensis]
MKRTFSPQRLDVRAFAEDGERLSGEARLADLPRLAAEGRPDGADPRVEWSARGELRHPNHLHPEVWLHLAAATELTLTCQRCLEAVAVPLSVARAFRFVADEDTAAAQDEQAEEDVLAISRSFDLLELVEDELLMEVPVVPRHEVCPRPVRLSAADADFDEGEPRENPFAHLKLLRDGKK